MNEPSKSDAEYIVNLKDSKPDIFAANYEYEPSPEVPNATPTGAPMTDGLYQVTTHYLCAGFVIEHGRVTVCAPILRKKLTYWKTIAVRIEP